MNSYKPVDLAKVVGCNSQVRSLAHWAGLFAVVGGLAACGSGGRALVDAGADGNPPLQSADGATERVEASADVPPPATCPVGLAPGQTDQTGCPTDPTAVVSCPRAAVCVYPDLVGQGQGVTYCSGTTGIISLTLCPSQCGAFVAGASTDVTPIDSSSCLSRPPMDCAPKLGLSDQDIVSTWISSVMQDCPALVENQVVVSFEGGCATEMRFGRAPLDGFAACLAEKLSAVRWTCPNLTCATVARSTLP
jgi:hypothetical protein